MKKKSNTPSSLAKQEIQRLLREVGLKRQDGLCFFLGKQVGGKRHECSGWANDGHLVLQYDHLNPRERNISYANPDLGVVICKGLHGWKSFSDGNKKLYDKVAMKYLSPARRKLWRRVEADRKSYPMVLWDWQKEIIALKKELTGCA